MQDEGKPQEAELCLPLEENEAKRDIRMGHLDSGRHRVVTALQVPSTREPFLCGKHVGLRVTGPWISSAVPQVTAWREGWTESVTDPRAVLGSRAVAMGCM